MLTSFSLPLTLATAADGTITAYSSRASFEANGGTGPTTQAFATYYLGEGGTPASTYPTPGFASGGFTTTSFWAESACLFWELPDGGFSMPLYPTAAAAEAAWPSSEGLGCTQLHLTQEAPEEELTAEEEAEAAAWLLSLEPSLTPEDEELLKALFDLD